MEKQNGKKLELAWQHHLHARNESLKQDREQEEDDDEDNERRRSMINVIEEKKNGHNETIEIETGKEKEEVTGNNLNKAEQPDNLN